MMLEMHPAIYLSDYADIHIKAREEFTKEMNLVRTNDLPDAS